MSDNKNIQPTRDTEAFIKEWIAAEEYAEKMRVEQTRANTELLNKTNELGRFLTPKDAKQDEVFNIWYGDGLLAVSKTDMFGGGSYKVRWRTRPTRLR
jgi:hypothetical protein